VTKEQWIERTTKSSGGSEMRELRQLKLRWRRHNKLLWDLFISSLLSTYCGLGFLWYKIIPLIRLMGGIKIFRLQEWKVRVTACTQSLNLAVAVVISPVIDSTLDNRCNKTNVNIWSHYQHFLHKSRR
jgi:hypothetical protein